METPTPEEHRDRGVPDEERLALPGHPMKYWEGSDRAVLREQEAGEAGADKARSRFMVCAVYTSAHIPDCTSTVRKDTIRDLS
jgi:hypothetical protein